MDLSQLFKAPLYICVLLAVFVLMELFSFDRKKKGVISLLCVGAWVISCMSLHLFQFFERGMIVMQMIILFSYLVLSRIAIYFINKDLTNVSDGVKYCLLSVISLFFILAMKFFGAPKFVLVGIYSFLFSFIIFGVVLISQKEKDVNNSLHADIATLSALIVNMFFLQLTGGALVVVSDFNTSICVFTLFLGCVGTVAMYVNEYTLTSLGMSVLLGLGSGFVSTFLVATLNMA